jgi:probable phosphoglycerate mutase
MRRLLILARHGNTFNAGEKVVMVGAREDLPLTKMGEQQAHALGVSLRSSGLRVQRVYAGSLKRTCEFGRLALLEISEPVIISLDPRLTELDYGEWEGLSDQEIVALSGVSALEAWQQRGERPQGISFLPPTDVLEEEMRTFLADISILTGVTLVVSSNGRLRELGRLCGGSQERSWKVGTGKICVLEYIETSWKIVAWDVVPERLAELVN